MLNYKKVDFLRIQRDSRRCSDSSGFEIFEFRSPRTAWTPTVLLPQAHGPGVHSLVDVGCASRRMLWPPRPAFPPVRRHTGCAGSASGSVVLTSVRVQSFLTGASDFPLGRLHFCSQSTRRGRAGSSVPRRPQLQTYVPAVAISGGTCT